MDAFKEKFINSAYLSIFILTVETVLLRGSEQVLSGIKVCILLEELTILSLYLRRRGTIICTLLISDSSQRASICVTVYNPKTSFRSGVQSHLVEIAVTKKIGFFYTVLKFFE